MGFFSKPRNKSCVLKKGLSTQNDRFDCPLFQRFARLAVVKVETSPLEGLENAEKSGVSAILGMANSPICAIGTDFYPAARLVFKEMREKQGGN